MPYKDLDDPGSGGGGGDVTSVFGRTGAITGQAGDYNADQINNGSINRFNESLQVVNQSGGTLLKGTPVYVVSTHANGKAIIEQASNDDAAKMPCVGVVSSDIDDGNEGLVLIRGILTQIDTSSLSVGAVLYVGTDSGSAYSETKPTGTALIQNMGYVVRSDASNGSFEVQGSGRTTDLPNLANGYMWVGDGSGVPTPVIAPSNGSFTKYEANEGNTPFTIPTWDAVVEVHNNIADIELILPAIDGASIGKEIKMWIEHNPANNKVLVKAPSTSDKINQIAADGADVAKAEYSSNAPNFFRVTAQSLAANSAYIDQVTSVYNTLRYVVNFSATSDFSPYSYLQLSAIPTNFLTDNANWWFAVKVETPMTNDSDGQVLFGSNNAFIAYRGNGTYFMTHSTSGYLMTISPNTIVESGQWIIFQNDTAANTYTAWVNGIKVLNATSSGVTMPTTAPTDMWFGSEEGQASPPSGYGYPLQQCRISNITIGTGNITDADAAKFTNGVFRTDFSLDSGAVAHEWTFSDSAPVTQVGAINLSSVGSNLSFEGL